VSVLRVLGSGLRGVLPPTRRYASAATRVTLLGALACGAFSLLWGLQVPINDDDVYHLHSTWLVAQGAVPYREFFEIHLPGLWLLLAPVVGRFTRASALLLAARLSIAVTAALLFALAARLVRGRGLQLGVLFIGMLGVLSYCQVWMFRVEYLTAVLVLLHLVLLAAWSEAPDRPWRAFVASLVLAFCCTVSVRTVPFAIVQPLVILLVARRAWPRALAAWGAGGVAGALPTLLYLGWHHLWGDAFQWSYRFVSSPDVVSWVFEIGRGELVVTAIGVACVLLLARLDTLGRGRRFVVAAAWGVALVFQLTNPHKVEYASLYLLLTTLLLVTAVAAGISARQGVLVRDGAAIVAGVGVIFFARLIALPSWPPDRTVQQQQLAVIDWLQDVAADEAVVLVAPYHPMLVHDATDLQQAGQYVGWLGAVPVRPRLRGVAARLLHDPPPVLAGVAWPELTGGRDLVDWLSELALIDAGERGALRALLAERYVRVQFPLLANIPGLAAGDSFDVRRDRLERYPPPAGSRVGG